jgi:peptidoglycan/LPS O-acetylase OafA/YrhL
MRAYTEPDMRRLPTLTAIRGLAALAILGFHTEVAFGISGDAEIRVNMLRTVVSLFFMMSGFILMIRYRPGDAQDFWLRRIARLLPVYYFAWMLTVFGRSLLHWDMTPVEMLASLSLMQAWLPDSTMAMAVNPPAWSLSCEAAFYLLLPLVAPTVLRASRRTLVTVTLTLFASLLALTIASSYWPLEWWIGLHSAEFGLGLVLAVWIRRGWTPARSASWLGSASVLAAVAAAALAIPISGPMANLLLAPAFFSMIAKSARPTTNRLWNTGGLQLLGRLSYSLYISHWIVVVMISRFGDGLAWQLVAVLVALVVAAVVHSWVERPLERFILRTWKRTRPTAASRSHESTVPECEANPTRSPSRIVAPRTGPPVTSRDGYKGTEPAVAPHSSR